MSVAAETARKPVFDVLVRLTHLAFITGVLAAWLTRHSRGSWHEWIGYAVLAALALRLLWGFVGTRHARFASFLRSPRVTIDYARRLWHGREPRYLGHNPLGAWMIVALLLTLLVICVSGWMFTTDRWFGYAWVIDTHEVATWVLFGLLPLHILGVLHASFKHRDNLIAAMIHGHKRAAVDRDIG